MKSLQEWQAIYDVGPGDHHFINVKTRKTFIKSIDLVYCRQCGVQMPLTMATLDHQGPQSNGANLALCRFFRSLGLTNGTGKGPKSKQFRKDYAGSVGGNKSAAAAGDRAARYTLNR